MLEIGNWIEKNTRFSFVRSGGPGGQNVNKVNTKAVAFLGIDEADGSPFSEEQLALLRERLSNRINSDGEIVVQAQRGRTQLQNRKQALERIKSLIASALKLRETRRPTKPTRRANERRLEMKRINAQKKIRRSDVTRYANE